MVRKLYLNKAVRETKDLVPSPTPGGSRLIKKTEENTRQRGSINEGEATKGSPAATITVTGIPACEEDLPWFSEPFRANVEPAGGLFRPGNGLRFLRGPPLGTPVVRPCGRPVTRSPQPCRHITISSAPRSSRANVRCVMKMPPRALRLKARVGVSGSESAMYRGAWLAPSEAHATLISAL